MLPTRTQLVLCAWQDHDGSDCVLEDGLVELLSQDRYLVTNISASASARAALLELTYHGRVLRDEAIGG